LIYSRYTCEQLLAKGALSTSPTLTLISTSSCSGASLSTFHLTGSHVPIPSQLCLEIEKCERCKSPTAFPLVPSYWRYHMHVNGHGRIYDSARSVHILSSATYTRVRPSTPGVHKTAPDLRISIDARSNQTSSISRHYLLAFGTDLGVVVRVLRLDADYLSCPILSPDRFKHLQDTGLVFTRLLIYDLPLSHIQGFFRLGNILGEMGLSPEA